LMGTNDLCLEMGIPGQLDNERVVTAIDTVIRACQKHGKWPGLGGVYVKDLAKRYISRGMRFVLAGNDLGLLMGSAQDQASFMRGWLEPPIASDRLDSAALDDIRRDAYAVDAALSLRGGLVERHEHAGGGLQLESA